MQGPAGTPYAGGLFLIEVKLPLEFPIAPPKLTFLTPIKHCNIKDGVPCPNLLYGTWSKSMTVHAVLTQLDQLLKEQQKGDALDAELAAMDPDTFTTVVQEAVRKHATADQEFAAPAAAASEKKEDALKWPHNYLILKGEFENGEQQEALLPRLKLTFGADDAAPAGAAPTAAPTAAAVPGAAAAVTPVEPAELRAQILGMTLELDGEALAPTDCYCLQPERAEVLAAVAEGLTVANGVAVTCTNGDGDVAETVVKVTGDPGAWSLEHCVFSDPIMFTEESVAALVEAQFVEGGPWVLSRAPLAAVEAEKASLFKVCVRLCAAVCEGVGVCRVVAVCGGVWRCVAVCGGVWRCVAVCGGVWRCVAVCGGVWRCVAVCGGVWRCVAVCGGVWQCVAVCAPPPPRGPTVVWGCNPGGASTQPGGRLCREVTCPAPRQPPGGCHDGAGRAPPGVGGLRGVAGLPAALSSPRHLLPFL